MFCTNCGAELPEGSKFCVKCGQPVEQEEGDGPKPKGYVFCTSCGEKNPAGQAFCTNCGARLPIMDDQGNYVDDTASAQPVPSPPQYGEQGPDVTQAAPVSGGAEGKKSSHGPMIAAIIVAVLMVGAGTAFGLHHFGVLGDKDPLGSTPKQEQTTDEGDGSDSSASDEADSASSDDSVSSDDSSSSSKPDAVIDNDEKADSQDKDDSSDSQKKSYTVVRQAMTWSDAEAYCESQGGRLASITSDEEWGEIIGLMDQAGGSVFWIGGYRDGSGNFAWVDGRNFSYQSWASGEPNNDGGSEGYMAILKSHGYYAWYDVPNDVSSVYKSDKMGFIMEKDA